VDVGRLKENILKLWADALEDEDVPQATKIRIARDAAAYLFAKQQAIAHVDADDLAEKLGKAISISQKVIDQRPMAPQVMKVQRRKPVRLCRTIPNRSLRTPSLDSAGCEKPPALIVAPRASLGALASY